jgi:NADH dehydrogenase
MNTDRGHIIEAPPEPIYDTVVVPELPPVAPAQQPEAAGAVTQIHALPAGRPRVVVVGAGFGGLSAARTLANRDVDVLVLDRNNYHGFWPLLYQVATAGLEPEAIAHPVRGIVRKYENVDFQMVEVVGIDFERKQVLTTGGDVPYDYLVLAAGSANNYFGNNALAASTFGLKDIDEAERLRNHVLTMFEKAAIERDPEKRAALLTFVMVGGGPTGVELAGSFIELIRHVLKKDYPVLDTSQARVILVEGTDSVLNTFPKGLQNTAKKRLVKMGVELMLSKIVSSVEDGVVTFKDGEHLAAGTIVWAAGVRGSQLADTLPVELGRGARVKITPFLNLPDRSEVFIIGDMAYLEGFNGTAAYPMVAPVAIQMGQQAARNILALNDKRSLKEFRYFDKGQMATIGRNSAVLDAFGIRLTGLLAWLGWLFIHLIELIGFRNRVVVLINWVYNYFTYDRGVRLITQNEEPSVLTSARPHTDAPPNSPAQH